jgi:hypothetical protein
LGGVAFILYRKIPLLLELPSSGETGKDAFLQAARKAKTRVQPRKVLDQATKEARKLAVRTERQTAAWTARLQQETRERQQEFQESYWDKLRKKGGKKSL